MEGKRLRREFGQASVYDQVYGSWGRQKWQDSEAVEHSGATPENYIHSQQSYTPGSPTLFPDTTVMGVPSAAVRYDRSNFMHACPAGALDYQQDKCQPRPGQLQPQASIPNHVTGPAVASSRYMTPEYARWHGHITPPTSMPPPIVRSSACTAPPAGEDQMKAVPSSSASARWSQPYLVPGSYKPFSPNFDKPCEQSAASYSNVGRRGRPETSVSPPAADSSAYLPPRSVPPQQGVFPTSKWEQYNRTQFQQGCPASYLQPPLSFSRHGLQTPSSVKMDARLVPLQPPASSALPVVRPTQQPAAAGMSYGQQGPFQAMSPHPHYDGSYSTTSLTERHSAGSGQTVPSVVAAYVQQWSQPLSSGFPDGSVRCTSGPDWRHFMAEPPRDEMHVMTGSVQRTVVDLAEAREGSPRLRGGSGGVVNVPQPTAGAGESKVADSAGEIITGGEETFFKEQVGGSMGTEIGGQSSRVEGGMVEGEGSRGDGSCPPGTVFVWDLDETLIIFQSLLTGKFASCQGGRKSAERARALAKVWERLILDISDTHMFFNQIEEWDQPTVETLAGFDDGADLTHYDFLNDGIGPPCSLAAKRKLAYRFRIVHHLYSKGLDGLLKEGQRREWEELYRSTDEYTDGWLTAGRRALVDTCSVDFGPMSQSCVRASPLGSTENGGTTSWSSASGCALLDGPPATTSGNVNVMVTSGQLIPTLAKCLLFRLNNFFGATEVYSSRDVGKLQCFQWIRERYAHTGKQFCAIGDGPDERAAAEHIGWAFVKVALGPMDLRIQNLTMARIQEAIARAEEIQRLKKKLSA